MRRLACCNVISGALLRPPTSGPPTPTGPQASHELYCVHAMLCNMASAHEPTASEDGLLSADEIGDLALGDKALEPKVPPCRAGMQLARIAPSTPFIRPVLRPKEHACLRPC